MNSYELLNKIGKIKMWPQKDKRAPHKPLLILLALRYLRIDKKKRIKYSEVETELGELLVKYGRSTTSINPHQPFWRLRKDDDGTIWRISGEENVEETSKKDAYISDLRKDEVSAGFTNEIIDLLEGDDEVFKNLVQFLLDENFPNSLHNEILHDVGLEFRYSSQRLQKERDSQFRTKVLYTYDHKCAVCEYDLRFFNKSLALEAAHIKWHKAGGPDKEENGIALCSIHHKLFDFGAIAIDNKLRLIISDNLQGSHNNLNRLLSMHKELINVPKVQSHYPKEEYIRWHHREVFKKKNK